MTNSSPAARPVSATVRLIRAADVDAVLSIEKRSFDYPWTPANFLDCLKRKPVVGYVATIAGKTVGYVIYEIVSGGMVILNLAVDPDFRRQSVGTQLVDEVLQKLTPRSRKWVSVTCSDSNLQTQLFLKAKGFRCIEIVRGNYKGMAVDGYHFCHQLGK